MSGFKTLLIAGLGLALPIGAVAQTGSRADLQYCALLSAKYERYIGRAEASTHRLVQRGSLDAQVAVAKCRQGDAASAIPVLEQKLANAKVELPPRGAGSRSPTFFPHAIP